MTTKGVFQIEEKGNQMRQNQPQAEQSYSKVYPCFIMSWHIHMAKRNELFKIGLFLTYFIVIYLYSFLTVLNINAVWGLHFYVFLEHIINTIQTQKGGGIITKIYLYQSITNTTNCKMIAWFMGRILYQLG